MTLLGDLKEGVGDFFQFCGLLNNIPTLMPNACFFLFLVLFLHTLFIHHDSMTGYSFTAPNKERLKFMMKAMTKYPFCTQKINISDPEWF